MYVWGLSIEYVIICYLIFFFYINLNFALYKYFNIVFKISFT